MKLMLATTAALALSSVAVQMPAQAGERGVSHPDPAPITIPAETPTAPIQRRATVNPDADIVTSPPATPSDDAGAYHPYRPYQPGGAATLATRPVVQAVPDPDADIVTSVPQREGELAEGTLVKVRMNDALSTRSTLRGAPFSATLTEDVRREGRVILPTGSVLEGQVTEVKGGKRIAGRAAIHLEPRRVTLPDGSYYILHAQVIDTGADNAVKVDGEGTLLRRDHPKEMLAILSLTTGSGAVAGAMIGGGVGAVVGAGLGAGVSTVLWLRQDRQAALPKDTALVFSLTTPMILQPLQDGARLQR